MLSEAELAELERVFQSHIRLDEQVRELVAEVRAARAVHQGKRDEQGNRWRRRWEDAAPSAKMALVADMLRVPTVDEQGHITGHTALITPEQARALLELPDAG